MLNHWKNCADSLVQSCHAKKIFVSNTVFIKVEATTATYLRYSNIPIYISQATSSHIDNQSRQPFPMFLIIFCQASFKKKYCFLIQMLGKFKDFDLKFVDFQVEYLIKQTSDDKFIVVSVRCVWNQTENYSHPSLSHCMEKFVWTRHACVPSQYF